MNWKAIDFYPIMGEQLNSKNTMKLDFSPANKDLEKVDLGNTAVFNEFVFGQLKQSGKIYGIGGYLEYRVIYRRSERFETSEADFRNIHLGVDIWTEAGATIYAPLDGEIYSIQDNAGFGDYGPTIILKHILNGKDLYSLYGHLTKTDLGLFEIGQQIKAGDLLCHVGPYPENGDWPPHLHFQLMWELGEIFGDYPGVCAKRELDYYAENCPNPNLVLNCEVLD
ncbi:peptidoglycan DD-metalloendopeptidase family protein [Algoriphagus marinus]|uniref:peptidoglycan DD-metalloendopeptidase family protein n=1 Tax=Algoriphagus marinus TaxID=1925762 RepID=UPI0009FAA4F7|nr:peptidoglycan DD-metalloendopeptidase family protein [Algoriphagus marinus]